MTYKLSKFTYSEFISSKKLRIPLGIFEESEILGILKNLGITEVLQEDCYFLDFEEVVEDGK